MDRRPHRHRRRAVTGRRPRGHLRDRLVLGVATIVAVLVGAAPAVGQSLSDGTPVNVVGPPATVLRADAHGQGRLVEAFGDVRRARNIAVIVPGVGWTGPLLSDERGAGRRHPAVQARSLLAAMERQAPGTPAAVVIWLDYDPPAGINADAARSDRALDGAPRLASFVDSLSRSATVSVVCHSYGSVVCAHAAPRLRIASLVVVGSPGMDMLDPCRPAHDGDRVGRPRPRRPDRCRPPHACGGIRPRLPTRLQPPSGRGRSRSTAPRHNGYLVAGTGSLRAIAQIATGQGATVAVPAP